MKLKLDRERTDRWILKLNFVEKKQGCKNERKKCEMHVNCGDGINRKNFAICRYPAKFISKDHLRKTEFYVCGIHRRCIDLMNKKLGLELCRKIEK